MANIIDNVLNDFLVPKEISFAVQALDEKDEDDDERGNNDVDNGKLDDETCHCTE